MSAQAVARLLARLLDLEAEAAWQSGDAEQAEYLDGLALRAGALAGWEA